MARRTSEIEIEKRLKKANVQSWEDLRRELPELLEIALNEKTKTTLLTEKKHPYFVRPINDMAKAIGIKGNPMLFITDEIPGIPVAYRKLPNAGGNPILNAIIMNPPLLELTKSNIHSAPTIELQGIVAHELSHIKHDLGSILFTHFGPMIAPIAGVAGLWLYNRAKKRKDLSPNNPPANEVKTFNKVIIDEANQELKHIDTEAHEKDKWHVDPTWKKAAVQLGSYMGVAATSYAAAMIISRPLSLHREFEADRLAVELTGDAEAFKNTLIELHKHAGSEYKKAPQAKSFADHFERAYHKLQGMTNHAHPTLKERITAIETYAEKIGLEKLAVETASHIR